MNCQQIRDEINSLENEEVLLKAAVDVKTVALQVIQNQLLQAQQDLMAAQQKLMANVQQQYVVHGQANALGCP